MKALSHYLTHGGVPCDRDRVHETKLRGRVRFIRNAFYLNDVLNHDRRRDTIAPNIRSMLDRTDRHLKSDPAPQRF